MSTRPCSLTFSEHPQFLVAGSQLTGYEVVSDSDCTFEIDGRGYLIRKDRLYEGRWISPDLTGSFTITLLPRFSTSTTMYMLFVVCGRVNFMQELSRQQTQPLITGDWCWSLDRFTVDSEAVALTKTYTGCMTLIQHAESVVGYRTGDSKVDAMLGMALCRNDLLGNKSPRSALEMLEDYQLRAVSQWHKTDFVKIA